MVKNKPGLLELFAAGLRTSQAIKSGTRPSEQDLKVLGINPKQVTWIG